jgi:diguanylate cyclase (GGDEF)-like protein
MKKYNVISLRIWIPVWVSLIFVMLIAVTIVNQQVIFNSEVVKLSKQFITHDTSSLIQEMEKELKLHNFVSAAQALTIRGIHREYKVLAILDSQGLVKYSIKKIWDGKFANNIFEEFDDNLFQTTYETLTSKTVVISDKQLIIGYFPVTFERQAREIRPSQSGILYLVYDLSLAQGSLWNKVWQSSQWPLFMSILSVLLIIGLLNVYISIPLKHLMSVTKQIAKGDLKVESKLHGSGELIRLGSSINEMSRNIEEHQQLLQYMANYDSLTGLANRYEFKRQVELRLTSDKNTQLPAAVCYMDLDQFKVINDNCGHAAGDQLLKQLSTLLLSEISSGDSLARMGGDEFGVLMIDVSIDDAHQRASHLLNVIQNFVFLWEGELYKIGVSIGLAPISVPYTFEALLKDVEAACYLAKETGRNQIHLYDKGDTDVKQRHTVMLWVAKINQAIERDSFCLYGQTIESLSDSSDIHYEILLRMIGEDGEVIAPGLFLPIAEQYDLIKKIDHWVISKAFKLLSSNETFLKKVTFCSINLSGQSMTDKSILNLIIEKFNETELSPSKICFEITETAAISNLNMARKFMGELKELGCKFALDDFGSGLSSFAYLKSLPVDYLKIDGMFVKDMAEDEVDHAMVKSINEIGQTLGMKTIAEFVENNLIKGMLKSLNVDYVQGYGIGKPQPFLEIIDAITMTEEKG